MKIGAIIALAVFILAWFPGKFSLMSSAALAFASFVIYYLYMKGFIVLNNPYPAYPGGYYPHPQGGYAQMANMGPSREEPAGIGFSE